MLVVKYTMLLMVFVFSTILGKKIAQKYSDRLNQLQEMKVTLSVFKSKIRFTYEPIPEIFKEIAEETKEPIKSIFTNTIQNMQEQTASIAWENAIENSKCDFKKEDKQNLKLLAKMLGTTDAQGQISQIEITENFLEQNMKQAEEEKEKNQKMYQKLGSIIGLAIVILLI